MEFPLMRRLVLLAVGLLLDAAAAWAHKPIFPGDNARDAAHAVPAKDIAVSTVAYHAATRQSPCVWIVFDGRKGPEIELQLGVPRLDRLKDLRPSVAVLGPGFPAWEGEFDVPHGLGGVVFRTVGEGAPKAFHEPFTGTNSWLFDKQKLVLPETGLYYLVGYLPGEGEGKFWLAFGHKEAYGLRDWLRLPGWIVRVRRFHEVSGMPRWLWLVGALAAAVAIW